MRAPAPVPAPPGNADRHPYVDIQPRSPTAGKRRSAPTARQSPPPGWGGVPPPRRPARRPLASSAGSERIALHPAARSPQRLAGVLHGKSRSAACAAAGSRAPGSRCPSLALRPARGLVRIIVRCGCTAARSDGRRFSPAASSRLPIEAAIPMQTVEPGYATYWAWCSCVIDPAQGDHAARAVDVEGDVLVPAPSDSRNSSCARDQQGHLVVHRPGEER